MGVLTEQTEKGEFFKSLIHESLAEYMQERGLDTMENQTQNKWNAALLHIGRRVKERNSLLKAEATDPKLLNGGLANNNAYDIELVYKLCCIYIDLCYEYDKEVSIAGFSKMTNISEDLIYVWGYEQRYINNNNNIGGKNNSRLSPTGIMIYKKLTKDHEESLRGMLVSGKGNPVGRLALLNHDLGYNMPGTSNNVPQAQSLTAENLPVLEQKYNDRSITTAPEQ